MKLDRLKPYCYKRSLKASELAIVEKSFATSAAVLIAILGDFYLLRGQPHDCKIVWLYPAIFFHAFCQDFL